jgi:hypothetical protein
VNPVQRPDGIIWSLLSTSTSGQTRSRSVSPTSTRAGLGSPHRRTPRSKPISTGFIGGFLRSPAEVVGGRVVVAQPVRPAVECWHHAVAEWPIEERGGLDDVTVSVRRYPMSVHGSSVAGPYGPPQHLPRARLPVTAEWFVPQPSDVAQLLTNRRFSSAKPSTRAINSATLT